MPYNWEMLSGAWIHPEEAVGQKLPDPIKASVPYFIVFMILEFVLSTCMGKKVYSLRQTVSNLSAGVFLQFFSVFAKALFIFPYAWLRHQVALIPDSERYSLVQNIIGFVLVDHGYYWFHRTAHMSNLGWAAHVTHHSSCDYNLSTALRQGVGESLYSWVYYLVLAPFAPLEIFTLHKGVNTVIQFWVHTEMIPKLWWPIEFVLNTPSHHRIHHARNYGRANFGGVLIVWDRLYGTFEAEEDSRPCIYGLDHKRVPTGTYNPLWQQAHHLVATLSLAASDPRHAFSALFTRRYGPGMVVPAMVDAKVSGEEKIPPAWQGLDPDPRRSNGWHPWEQRALTLLDWYAAFHLFAVLIPGGLILGEAVPHMAPGEVILVFLAAIASLVTSVGVMDGTRRALRWELVRLVGVVFLLHAFEDRLGHVTMRALMAVLAGSGLVILHQLAGTKAKAKGA